MVRPVPYVLCFYRPVRLGGTGKRRRENQFSFSSGLDAFPFQIPRRFFRTYDRRGVLNDFIIRFFSDVSFGLERSYGKFDFPFARNPLYFFLGVALSHISDSARLKEILLPLLMIPFTIPILLFGMESERKLERMPVFDPIPGIVILLSFCVFYAGIGILLLELSGDEL